ncbi:MAG: DsbA family protein, partial [Candidatus Paceibacterota bacterium]
RHYPIPQLHPRAFFQAEATECAWEQGGNNAFWKYTDRLFEVTPSNNGLADAELPLIAEYVGLNVEAFNDCLASGKFKNKIDSEISDGIKAGVNGTPSSFILVNGKVVDIIPGAKPYEAIMQQLSQIK